MPVKTVEVPELGTIKLYKRRASRHIRLSIGANGEVRVNMPYWTPYQVGLQFARANRKWIEEHRREPKLLRDQDQIGKAHRLYFVTDAACAVPRSRIAGTAVRIQMPTHMTTESPEVQDVAKLASLRALRQQASRLLPPRVAELANINGFTYKNVQIKRLKSRWGSCTQAGVIALNSYLMQLPWELIDYVILHELMHTKIMAHGPKFWTALAEYVPNLPAKRRAIRAYRPDLVNS